MDSAAAFNELVAALSAPENEGLPIQMVLPPGEYDVSTLLLDASSVVSGLWLISDPPGAAWLRAAGSELLTTTPAAPPLWVRGLRLRGRGRASSR